MTVTFEKFVKALEASGLLLRDELESVLAEEGVSDPSEHDPRQFAHRLVQSGKLTPFQASAVYQGKLGNLFLGNYEILDRIGEGGMGAVFKARHRLMRRIVAIKILPRKMLSDKSAVKRFRQEIRAAAQLEHPNIVTALDADEANKIHFLVMQYADGSDLGRFVKEQGPLSIRDAVDCIVQAARGLEHAHAKSIIHRDIKPRTCFSTRREQSKSSIRGLPAS